ncbi:AmpG family muropeptide MFS transporter [Neorickettsia sp. 179522]|uniref:AmpG family muropeptide MFS transporter n=1 Tax=Neorickettsia sp. 179522 TaxID=1714371 RepID=UPI000A866EC9|nr:MFS transporter [Neorickettsia sp. 179522]
MKRRKLLLSFYIKVIATFFLGFSCGVPTVLVAPTLSVWLAKAGVNCSSIGLFALVGIPYVVKFLFAPFFDLYTVPILGRCFGQKRGWILLLQQCVFFSIVGLSFMNPLKNIYLMGFFALVVAFFSSLQEVVVDNYRISILRTKEQLIGSSNVLLGWRVAHLISGALTLFLVDYLCNSYGLCEDFINWRILYIFSAFLSLSASVTVLCMGEPKLKALKKEMSTNSRSFLPETIIQPLREILQMKKSVYIIILVVIYRSCDSLIATMISPFLLEIGFSLTEIAVVAKTFGLLFLIVGGVIGSRIVYRYGIIKGLIFGAVVQMLSNVMFVVQSKVGYNLPLLYMTIATENICGSIATTSIIGYISGLASKARFSGSVYAIFSSLFIVDRSVLPVVAGLIADYFGWTVLFVTSVVSGLPALFLVLFLEKYAKIEKSSR